MARIVLISIALAMGVSTPSYSVAKPATLYTDVESLTSHLTIALNPQYCTERPNAFGGQNCEKHWRRFSKALFKRLRSLDLVHRGLDFEVTPYDARSRSFVLTHTGWSGDQDDPDEDLRYLPLVGERRCVTPQLGKPAIAQARTELRIRMPVHAARASHLRRTSETAIFVRVRGRKGAFSWCCARSDQTTAKARDLPCRVPVYQLTVIGYIIANSDDTYEEYRGIRTPFKVVPFDPETLGVRLP